MCLCVGLIYYFCPLTILLVSGNRYGTPKPPKDPADQLVQQANPDSAGLKEENRGPSQINVAHLKVQKSKKVENISVQPFGRNTSSENVHTATDLGPLPPGWEMALTEDGHSYYIEWVLCVGAIVHS